MAEPDLRLLEELCAIHAVSGREDRITAFVRDLIRPWVDELSVDNLGNVVGILKGARYPEHRLMLQAHMDEIGLIVRHITADGFVLVERVGGMPEKTLMAQRFDILTDDGRIVPGYVGAKSHHITTPDEKLRVPGVHDMFLDVGLRTRAEVEQAGIQVGDPATYAPNYHRFGDGMICSKALDNRASVFVLLETLRALSASRPPSTMVFSFSVLEEFSIRGSLPTVTATRPHAIISLDITIATDTPMDKPLHPVIMRGGPAVKMMDFHGRGTLAGLISSPKLRRFLERTARDRGINLQREVIIGVITDPAFQLYLDDKGYVIAGLSIPHRYSHAATQMCHEQDIFQTVELLKAAAAAFTPEVDLTRG